MKKSKKCFLADFGACGESDKTIVTIRTKEQLYLNPSMIGSIVIEAGETVSFCQYHAEYCGIIDRSPTVEELVFGSAYRGFEYVIE